MNVKYENKTAKTAMVKRLAREIGILGREGEWQLDANVYLKEQWHWAPGGLHHEYLCQQMFCHTTIAGMSE